MLINDAIDDARRLQASLRAMRVERAVLEEADLLCLALGHDPIENVLRFAFDALENIDAHLPSGTLAGLVRVRIRSLIGTLQALGKSSCTAEAANSEVFSQEELEQAARTGSGVAFLSPRQAWSAWRLAIPVERLQRPISARIAGILDAVHQVEVPHPRQLDHSGGERPIQATEPLPPAAAKQS